MRLMKGVVLLLLVAALGACGGLSRKEANRWLDDREKPAQINITGEWDSRDSLSGSWGRGKFYQDGNAFSGTLGKYQVDGVVSGEDIYMVLYIDTTVYYTAILKKSENGAHMGKAVYLTLADHKDARTAQSYLMTLKRIDR